MLALVTATDEKGLTSSATTSISISAPNQAPVINSFSATPNSGTVPLTVTFNVNVADDVGTPTLNIDYGDGNSGSSLTHTYTTVANRTATLTATDGGGLTASATTSITVQSADPCLYEPDEPKTRILHWYTGDTYIHYQGTLIAYLPGQHPMSYTTGGYTYTAGTLRPPSGGGINYYSVCRS